MAAMARIRHHSGRREHAPMGRSTILTGKQDLAPVVTLLSPLDREQRQVEY
jgi:hypothetical protein